MCIDLNSKSDALHAIRSRVNRRQLFGHANAEKGTGGSKDGLGGERAALDDAYRAVELWPRTDNLLLLRYMISPDLHLPSPSMITVLTPSAAFRLS